MVRQRPAKPRTAVRIRSAPLDPDLPDVLGCRSGLFSQALNPAETAFPPRCAECHVYATRRWRQKNRDAENERRREVNAVRTEELCRFVRAYHSRTGVA